MRLFFIRHGETTGDVEDRYGGAYDDVLSPLGEAQVRDLVHELKLFPFEKIFSNSLIRAKQTVKGLVDALGCPHQILPDLQERDSYGPLTGMTKTEARAQYPDFVEQVKDRQVTLPGAESYHDASNRMQRGYNQVLAQTQNCSAVVWHGGGMRVLFRDILAMGELESIGDCAWVELERSSPLASFTIKQSKRLTFSFPV